MKTSLAIVSLSALLCALLPTSHALATPPGGVGNDFVRSHPFSIVGLNVHSSALDVQEFRAAGMNTLLAWSEAQLQVPVASQAGLPWRAHVQPATPNGLDDWFKQLVAQISPHSGCQGWIVYDEPSRLAMPTVKAAADWVRKASPGHPVWAVALPSYATNELLYGDSSHPSYTWPQYLDDFIAMTGSDILSHDHYPFLDDGSTKATFFYDLMTIRAKGLKANLPYFAFLQSWAYPGWRLPSESDLRMQAYSYLAAGYSGLSYFTYDHNHQGGLLDGNGDPAPLYYVAQKLNKEIANLGKTLRFLTSTGVSYLPGKTNTTNPIPRGLRAWKPGDGGNTHLTAASVNTNKPAYRGEEKNGLLGFFKDDDGKQYFMLVNLSHGPRKSAKGEDLEFRLSFDSSVFNLLELNATTGKTTRIPLGGHNLTIGIPGGTGRLFKFDDGPFPTTDLKILWVRPENVNATSAYIRFKFNEKAQARVEYGTTTHYGNWTTKETSFQFAEHGQKIDGLSPATTYHFRVHGWDHEGQEVVSKDMTFYTIGDFIDAGSDAEADAAADGAEDTGTERDSGGTGGSLGTEAGADGAQSVDGGIEADGSLGGNGGQAGAGNGDQDGEQGAVDSADDSGCSCRVGGSGSGTRNHVLWLMAFLLGWTAVRRRARRKVGQSAN